MILVLLVAIAAITYANIQTTISNNRKLELGRLEQLSDLLSKTHFPINSPILENMKSLSGAEFALVNDAGKELARTGDVPGTALTSVISRGASISQIPLVDGKQSYYHTRVTVSDLTRRRPGRNSVHIFVPRLSERSIWWQASKSPLFIAMFVLPIALLVSFALAGQVTKPLAELESHVSKLAKGQPFTVSNSKTNDEIRDLNESFREMSVKLQDHEQQLLKNERLKTMVQFGNGIAHRLRNSSTGCKMAIELLASENEDNAQSENFLVATRQLELLDSYIKKFIMLSQETHDVGEVENCATDLSEVIQHVEFLLKPTATHLNVELEMQTTLDGSTVAINKDDAEQLMINLVGNAIVAASENTTARDNLRANVTVELDVNDGAVKLVVSDNGNGPAEEIADTMFQPFVTGSREGVGLGLSLVQEIVERTNGNIAWQRVGGRTQFVFSIPQQSIEKR